MAFLYLRSLLLTDPLMSYSYFCCFQLLHLCLFSGDDTVFFLSVLLSLLPVNCEKFQMMQATATRTGSLC